MIYYASKDRRASDIHMWATDWSVSVL